MQALWWTIPLSILFWLCLLFGVARCADASEIEIHQAAVHIYTPTMMADTRYQDITPGVGLIYNHLGLGIYRNSIKFEERFSLYAIYHKQAGRQWGYEAGIVTGYQGTCVSICGATLMPMLALYRDYKHARIRVIPGITVAISVSYLLER